MKKIVLVISVLFLLSGCANIQTWKYTSEAKEYREAKNQLTVVVPPMRDTRKNENGARASALLALIPGVPYSKGSVFNTPDSILITMKGPEDLSKATAEELNNAAVFKNVHYDFQTSSDDLILEGTLKKMRVKSYWFLYGLSLPGDLLWYVGLPATKVHNDLIIDFKLKDKKGKVYFEKEYSAHDEWYSGFYYNVEQIRFEKLAKEVNMKLVSDLNDVKIKLKN